MKLRAVLSAVACATLVGLAAPVLAQQPAAQVVSAKPPQATLPAPAPKKAFGIVEVSAPARAKTLVIFFSGDGGWWGDIDRKLGERIRDAGYAIVAVDTNKWFKERKTADQMTALLSSLIKDYRARTGATQVALIGYSFGADVVPLALNRLAPDVAKSIGAIALMSPARGLDPQVTLMEQVGLVEPTISLAPEFTQLPVKKILCMYGSDQKDESGCTTPQMQISKKIVELPGGHHFDGDQDHISEPVLAFLAEMTPAK